VDDEAEEEEEEEQDNNNRNAMQTSWNTIWQGITPAQTRLDPTIPSHLMHIVRILSTNRNIMMSSQSIHAQALMNPLTIINISHKRSAKSPHVTSQGPIGSSYGPSGALPPTYSPADLHHVRRKYVKPPSLI